MNTIDRDYLKAAVNEAAWSRDPSTKVGCIITSPDGKEVIAYGHNSFATGIKDDLALYHDREAKLARTVHAEINTILEAANCGKNVRGMTLYTTLFPCDRCALIIIQAGIARVVSPAPDYVGMERWRASWDMAKQLFSEARVKMVWYPNEV